MEYCKSTALSWPWFVYQPWLCLLRARAGSGWREGRRPDRSVLKILDMALLPLALLTTYLSDRSIVNRESPPG